MAHLTNDLIIPLFESFCKKTQIDGKIIEIKIGDTKILAEVASIPTSQARGFMYRPEPKDGTGIIFIYDQEQPLSFWMKNVEFPLDILFFDSKLDLVNYMTMKKFNGALDQALPRYSSIRPAQFAVELPAGWCNTNLAKDSKLSF